MAPGEFPALRRAARSWQPRQGLRCQGAGRHPAGAREARRARCDPASAGLPPGCVSCQRLPVVAPGASCGAVPRRRINSCKCVRQAAYGRAWPVAGHHPIVTGHFAIDLQAAADPIESPGLKKKTALARTPAPVASNRPSGAGAPTRDTAPARIPPHSIQSIPDCGKDRSRGGRNRLPWAPVLRSRPAPGCCPAGRTHELFASVREYGQSSRAREPAGCLRSPATPVPHRPATSCNRNGPTASHADGLSSASGTDAAARESA